MKKLTKKQIGLMVLFCISTILLIWLTFFLTNNLFNSSIPLIKTMLEQLGYIDWQLKQVIFYNILAQLTILFFYSLFVWLGIESFKRDKRKQLDDSSAAK